MKKNIVFLLVLLLIASLNAISNERISTVGNSVDYSYRMDTREEIPERLSRTFAIPATEAVLTINSAQLTTYDELGNIVESTRDIDENIATIAHNFQMREMYGFTVVMNATQETERGTTVLEAIDFTLTGINSVEIPESVSEAFRATYSKLADNFEDSYLQTLPLARPKMLIINSSSSANVYVNEFARWKRASGFVVDIIMKDNTWDTAAHVKQHIYSYYEEHHPDYILLLGDTIGELSIPTNMYISPDGTENDADDNFYTMLEGDDYFPEAMIGRFSANDTSQLLTMIIKTRNYERNQLSDNNEWMHKSLVVAGNFAEGQLQPSTPVRMSKWIRERMFEAGYAQVDTVFYPPTFPGTSSIISGINNGAQYISYRGWGDANGWHYPLFHKEDLDQTSNLNQLPIVYSIVCNTGDFANSVNPNFGEKWMRMGTPANPSGCVAFVGPSDLHTKTKLNNAISAGMFSSFLQDGNRIFGTTVLDGKVELYKNYPLDIEDGGLVAFYFHVYNMLCDPSLKMWVLEPNTLFTDLPQSLDSGTSYIELDLPGLHNAFVTTTKDDLSFEYVRVDNGHAIVPIDTSIEGDEVKLQITKSNYEPLRVTIPINANSNIAVSDIDVDGQFQPGYNSTLDIEVLNHGSEYNNVTATLVSNNPNVTVTNNTANISSISNNGTSNISFEVSVSDVAEFGEMAQFDLEFSQSENTEKFSLPLGGGFLQLEDKSGEMLVGNSSELSFTFENIGNEALASGTVRIRALHTAILNSDLEVSYGATEENEDLTITFSPEVAADATPGAHVPFRFDFIENASGYTLTQFAVANVGGVESTDPTGPDTYGYWAYDSFDTDYSQAPSYDWMEIDPRDGGNGQVTLVGDDESFVTSLPFSFKYYGEDFDQITICSNGWASFGSTWYINFRNLNIPSLLGPKYQLCPYWDDLKGLQSEENVFDDMRIITYHDQANNRYIIEWNDCYSQYTINQFENAELEKFQVILEPMNNEDGDITYQYHTITNPAITSNYSTVGIENGIQEDGVLYTYADIYPESGNELQNGMAIKFTKNAPDEYVSNDPEQALLSNSLSQNYPNPFNPETNISFSLKENYDDVNLSVYNVKGQLVKTLVAGEMMKGAHNIVWNGTNNNDSNVASGVYYYKLKTADKTLTRKMILMK